MWVPLVALAIFATIGGFIGVGPAWKFITRAEHAGGRMNIVTFRDPILWNPSTREFGREGGGGRQEAEGSTTTSREFSVSSAAQTHSGVRETAEPYGITGFNLAHAAESKLKNETVTEWLFIVISLLVAGTGIGLGLLFYVKDTRLPDLWAGKLRPLYEASYNKYWVDEFYGWAITRRTMDLARAVFAFDSRVVDGGVNGSAWLTRWWSRITGGFDKYVVDGLVNTIAAFVIRLVSPLIRAAQTGFVANYALMMVLGLVIVVAMFFGADIIERLKAIFAISF